MRIHYFSVSRLVLLAFFLLGAFICTPSTRAEDVAIVVDVARYADRKFHDLPGVEQDGAAMEQLLTALKFSVIRLSDSGATPDSVTTAFVTAKKRLGATDRFIYYQSSHGAPGGWLLLGNTTWDGSKELLKNGLSLAMLRNRMDSLPTNRRSVILDACFAGFFRTRAGSAIIPKGVSIHPKNTPEIENTPPGDSDTPIQGQSINKDLVLMQRSDSAPFAVFASSTEKETSGVAFFAEGRASIFTHFLLESARAAQLLTGTSRIAWSSLVQRTISQVAEYTENAQSPVFTDQYLPYVCFGAEKETLQEAADPARTIETLTGLYDFINSNEQRLSLRWSASRAPDALGRFLPNTGMKFYLQPGQAGWLFLINCDDSGHAWLFPWDGVSPMDTSLDTRAFLERARIAPREEFVAGTPRYGVATSRRDGFERWKAILFLKQHDASAFASAWYKLPKAATLSDLRGARLSSPLRVVTGEDGTVFTAEVRYNVTSEADKP